MVVQLSHPDLASQGDMVLKIFDRRFAPQDRKDYKCGPWTPNIEEEYHQFAIDGSASRFIAELNSEDEITSQEDEDEDGDDDEEEEADEWNNSQTEAFLHNHMSVYYNCEVEVYNTLKDLQGKDVPQLFASVTIPIAINPPTSSASQFVDPPGILLQYITGFELTDLAECAPRECWQSIGEDAIRVVNLVGDRGILNQDVKRRNLIVQKQKEYAFKVFMIDFALCQFRRDFEDEAKWDHMKAHQDEEGAVGRVLERELKGGFKYNRSARYEQLDWDFMMEDGPRR